MLHPAGYPPGIEVDIYARLSLGRTGSKLGMDQEIRAELVASGWIVRHIRIDDDLPAVARAYAD